MQIPMQVHRIPFKYPFFYSGRVILKLNLSLDCPPRKGHHIYVSKCAVVSGEYWSFIYCKERGSLSVAWI